MTYVRCGWFGCVLVLTLTLTLAMACGDDDTGGTDGGDTRRDGGTTITDGGSGADAGQTQDAGTSIDGGSQDGGTVTDGGSQDGGTVADGGGAQDAGSGTDGGSDVDGGKPVDRCSDIDVANQCIACVLEKAPETEADCSCTGCPSFPATQTECRQRLTQYNRVCAEWMRNNPCPLILCTEPPPVACVDGDCLLTRR